jgi:L-cysteine:1D-myo-inositol 2-amino-2-deoxy-alpha-D-glucopyranoside ligase
MQLYNSLTKTKETFVPINDKEVSMYVCGITPYDTTHLGHAFTYLSFDILNRYLKYQGYDVNYVQNVTDIDDDILRKAKEVGKDWQALGQWWTDKFLHDLEELHIMMPTHYVKATESILTMITIIEKLIEKKVAYAVDGTVFFRVKNDVDYGKLSGYSREEMIRLSKERGANPDDPRKEDPLDFIMWQSSKADEPSWESPWGKGRPGWHIECSAMAYKYIDKRVDIHGGGSDLLYPHHESEIAQSENFTDVKPFVTYWMHTGAVGYQGQKMSKSLGNLIMVSELLKKHSPETLRYLLLSHHYRTPWEFHEEDLQEAEKKNSLIQKALLKEPLEEGTTEKETQQAFFKALDDDLDTPHALTILTQSAQQQVEQATKSRYQVLRTMYSVLF